MLQFNRDNSLSLLSYLFLKSGEQFLFCSFLFIFSSPKNGGGESLPLGIITSIIPAVSIISSIGWEGGCVCSRGGGGEHGMLSLQIFFTSLKRVWEGEVSRGCLACRYSLPH